MPGSDVGSSRPLLVVDAANVVGSRPDGWWRDRGAAARRLLDALVAWRPEDTDVALVVEGAARRGVGTGTVDGVRVVHASGSGDDEIVRVVAGAGQGPDGARPVTVVTADRGLRARVEAHGAGTAGPHWLWERVSHAGPDGG